jgi:hypothetical protein
MTLFNTSHPSAHASRLEEAALQALVLALQLRALRPDHLQLLDERIDDVVDRDPLVRGAPNPAPTT